ncbi:TBC1 domain family member 22B [Hypsibius exemplaris]|uniref:TBC1 domain family member 22B n=1 Tax=Hypsibius exemplaris TaxID=2072580 RepID=A0A1W0WGZ7_HYPEX|nr:TBC1 domain family member 22B [Hypsibius exemplaris]
MDNNDSSGPTSNYQHHSLAIRQNKWRYRGLYPGTLLLLAADSNVDVALPPTSSPNCSTAAAVHLSFSTPPRKSHLNGKSNHRSDDRKVNQVSSSTAVTAANGTTAVSRLIVQSPKMESFKKYESDVSDAWSTDAEDNADKPTAGSTAHGGPGETLNGGSSSFRAPVNRISSDHLRAKGLQRLALQSGATSDVRHGHHQRPGLAVRSVSMGFAESSSSGVSSAVPLASGVEFLPRNAQKTEKFEKLLGADKASVDMDELRKLSWSGVPSNMRARIWRMLTGYVPPICDLHKVQEYLQRKREEYRSLVSEYYPKREDDQYKDTFRQIHIDVPRMCPLVPLFQQITVQELFERILFIWALRNPASGYVQGINDLVTPYFIVFLHNHVPNKEVVETYDCQALSPDVLFALEADCFWCLSKLLAGIQSNYTFAQPGIQQRVVQLKELVQRVDPDLHSHLEKCSVEYLQFSFRWMNCLLIRELPLQCIIRLWDSYHSEPDGFANFHVYVCASFLLWWSEDLRNQPDFQYALIFLQNLPTQNWGEDETERLLAKAFMLKYTFADAPMHLKSMAN